jgi:hypothetical protein
VASVSVTVWVTTVIKDSVIVVGRVTVKYLGVQAVNIKVIVNKKISNNVFTSSPYGFNVLSESRPFFP